MITLGEVYPHLWATNGKETQTNFHIHLSVLKPTFCVFHKVFGESENFFHTLLSK